MTKPKKMTGEDFQTEVSLAPDNPIVAGVSGYAFVEILMNCERPAS